MSLLIKLQDVAKSDDIGGAASSLREVNSDGGQMVHQKWVPLATNAPEGGSAPRKGRVQSAIAALFRAQPDRVFTAVDLAQAIHGQATRTTCKTIRRAADGVAKELGWTRRKMWGRVDYVRPETVSRITRLRAEKAAQLRYP